MVSRFEKTKKALSNLHWLLIPRIQRSAIAPLILSIVILFSGFYYIINLSFSEKLKEELVIPQLISILGFAFLVIQMFFNSEKLCIDLFKPRFENYTNCLNYCKIIANIEANCQISDATKSEIFKVASLSFRGDGLVSAYFLFEKDIQKLYQKINHAADIIEYYNSNLFEGSELIIQRKIYKESLEDVKKIYDSLPNKFSKYFSFWNIY